MIYPLIKVKFLCEKFYILHHDWEEATCAHLLMTGVGTEELKGNGVSCLPRCGEIRLCNKPHPPSHLSLRKGPTEIYYTCIS